MSAAVRYLKKTINDRQLGTYKPDHGSGRKTISKSYQSNFPRSVSFFQRSGHCGGASALFEDYGGGERDGAGWRAVVGDRDVEVWMQAFLRWSIGVGAARKRQRRHRRGSGRSKADGPGPFCPCRRCSEVSDQDPACGADANAVSAGGDWPLDLGNVFF